MILNESRTPTILIAALTAVALVFSIFGAPFVMKAHAADAEAAPSFTLSDKTASAGESVELELKMANNPGILGATVVITYDEGLALKDVTAGEAFSALTMTKPGQYVSGCKLHWDVADINSSDVKDGTIATLSFDITSDAVNGDHVVEVKPDENNGSDDVYDRELNIIAVTPAQCKVTVSGGADPAPNRAGVDVTIDGQGQVSGGGEHEIGADVTLVATPDDGWHFAGWYIGGELVSENASYTFALTDDAALTAKFVQDAPSQPEKVTVTVNVDGKGTVGGVGTYDKGASVTLTATPADDSNFDGWYANGNKVSSSSPYDITLSVDIVYTAKFTAKQTGGSSGGGNGGGNTSSGSNPSGGNPSGGNTGGGTVTPQPTQEQLDTAVAAAVSESIAKLPSVDAATLSDKAEIDKAEKDYSGLTDAQKDKVPAGDKEKLEWLVTKMDDMEAAATVEDAIDALPSVDELVLADKAAVDDAHTAYTLLSPDATNYVSSAAKDKLSALMNKIAGLDAPTQPALPGEEPAPADGSGGSVVVLPDRPTVEPGEISGSTETTETSATTEPAATPPTPQQPAEQAQPPATAPAPKANPMKVTVSKKTVKVKTLKKAKKTLKAIKVQDAQGEVSFKKVSDSKRLTLNKATGKVTVKKGTKKGTYKIKVEIAAAGNAEYSSANVLKTITVRVK